MATYRFGTREDQLHFEAAVNGRAQHIRHFERALAAGADLEGQPLTDRDRDWIVGKIAGLKGQIARIKGRAA